MLAKIIIACVFLTFVCAEYIESDVNSNLETYGGVSNDGHDTNAIVLLISLTVDLRWCVYSTANEVMYSFRYAVEATETKVITHHNENRKGDLVRGSYSLLDSDGRIRTVEYQVDGPRGFNAIVKFRKPPGQAAAGHLRFPNYYRRPLHLAQPVGLITKEVLQARKSYPTLTL